MNMTSNMTGLIIGCLMVSAWTSLAVDPCDLLGKPFTLETAVSLWPSNSVIKVQSRSFSIEPVNILNPIWKQEAYLVDRPEVDDDAVWYQKPVIKYDVSKSPTNTAGILMKVHVYTHDTNQPPVHGLLSKYRITTLSLTNMCVRFPNQAWTGIDEVTFHEDRTIGISNLPPVRVSYCFKDGWLDRVSIALPSNAPDFRRNVAVKTYDSSESIIDLPFLMRPSIHVLGEYDIEWSEYVKNSRLEKVKLKVKELKESDRAKVGEKTFGYLKELGVYPVAYICDPRSRPPESDGFYASSTMGIVVETAVSCPFGLEFESILYIFVNFKKMGKDIKIRIAKDRFLPKTEAECKKSLKINFESRRYDGEYKIWLCNNRITLLIDKNGDVCMVGVDYFRTDSISEPTARYFIRRMIRYHEAQSLMDLYD